MNNNGLTLRGRGRCRPERHRERAGQRLNTLFLALALLVTPLLVTRGEARLVRDQLGREILVPDEPKRVVSLAPSITEIVFALGAGHLLQGVTQHCDYPPEAEALPKIGSYVRLDVERIVALKPDLCLGTRDGNPQEAAAKLEAMNIPLYAVNPRDLETVMDTLLEIGRLLHTEQRAEQLVKEMRERIEGVKTRVAKTQERPTVFFQIGIVPIVSVGTNTFIDRLIATAGGRNLAAGSTPYPRFSKEQVVSLKPEVIIITSMTRGQDFEPVRDDWNQWSSLPAVRERRVHIVESDLFDRPSPRLVEGLELLCRLIHPELW